jgi:hypothetical protein
MRNPDETLIFPQAVKPRPSRHEHDHPLNAPLSGGIAGEIAGAIYGGDRWWNCANVLQGTFCRFRIPLPICKLCNATCLSGWI